MGIPGEPDNPNNRTCRQHADQSYAGQARTTEVNAGHLIAFKFAACSGAVTADILTRTQPGTSQFKQLDYVTANTPDIVTLTVGGNDIRFPSIATKCVLNVLPWLVACPADSNSMQLANAGKKERKSWDGLFDRLVKTYVAVRKAQPTGGNLFVLSYSVPFDNPLHWNLANVLTNNCHGFSMKETRLANALSVRLGDTIYLATQEANRQVGHVHFVDWRPPVTIEAIGGRSQRVAYDPNGLCSRNGAATSNTHGLLLPGISPAGLDFHDSFHPTQRGYSGGASALVSSLQAHVFN